jgi:hypothetical protein
MAKPKTKAQLELQIKRLEFDLLTCEEQIKNLLDNKSKSDEEITHLINDKDRLFDVINQVGIMVIGANWKNYASHSQILTNLNIIIDSEKSLKGEIQGAVKMSATLFKEAVYNLHSKNGN